MQICSDIGVLKKQITNDIIFSLFFIQFQIIDVRNFIQHLFPRGSRIRPTTSSISNAAKTKVVE